MKVKSIKSMIMKETWSEEDTEFCKRRDDDIIIIMMIMTLLIVCLVGMVRPLSVF